MIKLLGRIDGIVIALIGGLGWVLQSRGHHALAVLMAIFTMVVGLIGASGALAVWLLGGHQSPALTGSAGHLAPSLLRAALLIGLGWVGAWAAAKAGVEGEGAAVAISVAVFGALGDIIKPLREAADGLRPVAFAKAATMHVYRHSFDVNPADPEVPTINGRAAVYDDPARIHNGEGRHVETISGWKRSARIRRLEVVAAGL